MLDFNYIYSLPLCKVDVFLLVLCSVSVLRTWWLQKSFSSLRQVSFFRLSLDSVPQKVCCVWNFYDLLLFSMMAGSHWPGSQHDSWRDWIEGSRVMEDPSHKNTVELPTPFLLWISQILVPVDIIPKLGSRGGLWFNRTISLIN